MISGKLVVLSALAFLQMDRSDQNLIKMVHETNQMEIEAGAIARSNAGSKDVKDYARMLEQDHSKADQQILQLAKQKQVELSTEKTPNKALDELRHSKGDAFDQKFLQMMVDDHDKAIQDLTKKLTDIKDPQLKLVIQEMLPALQRHRDTAQALLQKKAS